MSTYYVIKSTPDTPNEEGEKFIATEIVGAVIERSGRDRALVASLVGKLNATKVRVYVAVNRSHRELSGRGFIVERVQNAGSVTDVTQNPERSR